MHQQQLGSSWSCVTSVCTCVVVLLLGNFCDSRLSLLRWVSGRSQACVSLPLLPGPGGSLDATFHVP